MSWKCLILGHMWKYLGQLTWYCMRCGYEQKDKAPVPMCGAEVALRMAVLFLLTLFSCAAIAAFLFLGLTGCTPGPGLDARGCYAGNAREGGSIWRAAGRIPLVDDAGQSAPKGYVGFGGFAVELRDKAGNLLGRQSIDVRGRPGERVWAKGRIPLEDRDRALVEDVRYTMRFCGFLDGKESEVE